ncbi:Hypothetical predicted protein [Pelobates cultripes]|uniref:Uncharacterized protein n=1 Tax=Pelobates cultripes TaxID=61616 RepID=A0AAD1S6P7_PELCU|nr:Hypothetical predicted protein [Pelobates cultripes]
MEPPRFTLRGVPTTDDVLTQHTPKGRQTLTMKSQNASLLPYTLEWPQNYTKLQATQSEPILY